MLSRDLLLSHILRINWDKSSHGYRFSFHCTRLHPPGDNSFAIDPDLRWYVSVTWISRLCIDFVPGSRTCRESRDSIIHESDTPSVDLRRRGRFPFTLSRYPFPFTIPFHLANPAPAASVLVSPEKFSRSRVALPAGVSSSESFRHGIVYSSQLDDIRCAKLHFTTILDLLHDLVAATVLIQLDIAPRTIVLVIFFLLQILQNLASI